MTGYTGESLHGACKEERERERERERGACKEGRTGTAIAGSEKQEKIRSCVVERLHRHVAGGNSCDQVFVKR